MKYRSVVIGPEEVMPELKPISLPIMHPQFEQIPISIPIEADVVPIFTLTGRNVNALTPPVLQPSIDLNAPLPDDDGFGGSLCKESDAFSSPFETIVSEQRMIGNFLKMTRL